MRSIQDQIKDAKLKVDELLYERDVLFLIDESASKNDEYQVYSYITSPNRRKKFAVIGYNNEKQCIAFACEWMEMSKRNRLEDMPDPEFFLLMNDVNEFVDYLAGVPLTKIFDKRKDIDKKNIEET